MKYNVIATGSTGNAVVINNVVMVDCGVTFKALKDVYKELKIVLLTHIHTDHFSKSTIKRLAKERPTLYFACCKWLVGDLIECNVSKKNIFVMKTDELYNCGSIKLSPFKLTHDVKNCGWRIHFKNEKALYCTDTGTLEGIKADNYDLYLIEANYGEVEIQERIQEKIRNGEFIYERRVLKTHLSKEQADLFLLDNMGENSEVVYLHGHQEKSENWEYENGI